MPPKCEHIRELGGSGLYGCVKCSFGYSGVFEKAVEGDYYLIA